MIVAKRAAKAGCIEHQAVACLDRLGIGGAGEITHDGDFGEGLTRTDEMQYMLAAVRTLCL